MATHPSNSSRDFPFALNSQVVKDEAEEICSPLTAVREREEIRTSRPSSYLTEDHHESSRGRKRQRCYQLASSRHTVNFEDDERPAIRRALDALEKAQLSLKDALGVVKGAANELDDANLDSTEDFYSEEEEEGIDCSGAPTLQSSTVVRNSADGGDGDGYHSHLALGKNVVVESERIAPMKMSSRGMVRTGKLSQSNEYIRALAQIGIRCISKCYAKSPPKCQDKRRTFKHDLWEFNLERGRKTRVRVLNKNALDHFDVMREVLELGGFKATVAALGMNYVCRRLGYGNASKSGIGSSLKTMYLEDLFHYEQVMVHGRMPTEKLIAELSVNSYDLRVKMLRRDSRRKN